MESFSRRILLTFIAFMICSCTPKYVSVTGQVLDSETNQPVASARVILNRSFNDGFLFVLMRYGYLNEESNGETDASGRFLLNNVIKYSRMPKANNTLLSVTKERYVPFILRTYIDPIPSHFEIKLIAKETITELPQGYVSFEKVVFGNNKEEFYFSFTNQGFVGSEEEADLSFVYKTFDFEEIPKGLSSISSTEPNKFRVFWEIRTLGKGSIAIVPKEKVYAFEALNDCSGYKFEEKIYLASEPQKVYPPTFFCVKTRNGKNHAKFSLGYFENAIYWVFQPDGTSKVGTAMTHPRLRNMDY